MSQEKKQEKQIVKSVLENPDNFGEIIDLYEAKLTRFLFHLGVKNHDDKEDLLQEVFFKVYKNLNDYDFDLKLSAWIYRIARNSTYDFFRKIKSRGLKIDFNEDEAEVFWENLLDDSQNIEKNFDKKKRQRIVLNIIKKLPEKYSEMLMLFFLEEKSYKEISDILQKPQNTIAVYISRAKENFKAEFTKKYHPNEI